MINPGQEIFTKIMSISKDLGYKTYDYLPGEVGYPFVFIGEQFSQDIPNKSAVFGTIQQRIHVYGYSTQRGTVSSMMDEILRECRKLESTNHFYVSITQNVSQQIIPDNSTNTPLNHGILEVEFKFN